MTRGTAQILMEGKEQLKIGALPSSMNYFVKHLIILHHPQLSSPAYVQKTKTYPITKRRSLLIYFKNCSSAIL